MRYANEPSQVALKRARQKVHSKPTVWTVDDVARLIEYSKRFDQPVV